MFRSRAAIALSLCNLTLTCLALACIAGGFVSGLRPADYAPTLDLALAAVVWLYLGTTPMLGAAGLILGDRRRQIIMTNYLLLVAWLVFIVWTSTMTL